MGRTRLTILLLALASSIAQPAPSQKDAVVQIWTETNAGAHGLGTGFFISDSGTILTCYHVIQGAKDIRVVHRTNSDKGVERYSGSDVEVHSYSPTRDLAKLLVKTSKPTPFISLLFDPPTWKEGERMTLYGHPHGLSYSHLNAYATHTGYVPCKEILDHRLAPLFDRSDISLVMLEARVYGGMSGGPVLSSAGCIGVLSGSKAEGGTIMWAIPCFYARESKQMINVGKPAKDILNWPPLTLMNQKRWRSLRKYARIETTTQTDLGDYFSLVETLSVLYDKISIQGLDAKSHADVLRILINGNPSDSLINTPAYKHARKGMAETWKALDDTWREAGHAKMRLLKRREELERRVTDLCRTLPRSQKNEKVATRYQHISRELRNRFAAQSEHWDRFDKASRDATKAMSRIPRNLRELRVFLTKIQTYLGIVADISFAQHLATDIRSFRDLGYVYEEFFTEDFDSREMAWVFYSDKGYRFVLPAGWQISGWPDDPDTAKIDRNYRAAGLSPEVYLFRDMDETGNDREDTIAVNVCTVREPLEPIMDGQEEWFRGTLAKLYEESENAEISIRQEGQRQIFASYIPTQRGDTYVGIAIVIDATVTLVFEIPYFPRRHLNTMKTAVRAILSSIESES